MGELSPSSFCYNGGGEVRGSGERAQLSSSGYTMKNVAEGLKERPLTDLPGGRGSEIYLTTLGGGNIEIL